MDDGYFRRLIAEAKKQGVDSQIPPVAVSVTLVDGFDPSADSTLLQPSVLLTPCVHPTLEAFLETAGATRRGRMSWVIGLGEHYNPAPLNVVLTRPLAGTVFPEALTRTQRAAKPLDDIAPNMKAHKAFELLNGSAAAVDYGRLTRIVNHAFPATGPGRFGAITLSGDDRVMWVKVITNEFVVPEDVAPVTLNLRPAGKPFTDPRPVRPVDAIAALDWLVSEGVTVIDSSGVDAVAKLRSRVRSSVIATPVPGKPALAKASIGRAVFGQVADLPVPCPPRGQAAVSDVLRAEQVMALVRTLPAGTAVIHPGTEDAGAMALAVPVDNPLLRFYQAEAVGVHLATKLGYVQTSSPGMGKTICQYAAMALRAHAHRSRKGRPYRGLAVVEAAHRAQWKNEGATWFPDAEIIAIESRADAGKLAEAMATIDGPVLAIVSYPLLAAVTHELNRRAENAIEADLSTDVGFLSALAELTQTASAKVSDGQMDLFSLLAAPAATVAGGDEPETVPLGALLLDTRWDDIVADEAEVLRGDGSKQAAALWELRRNSDVAVVLTGTPINRGIDDLGKFISWVRNDEQLFNNVKLSKQFDLSDDAQLPLFLEAMGPVVFRRDLSEISHEVPQITPTVLKLTPFAEEKALAHAAESELKRVYQEVLAWVEMVEATDPDNPEYAQAREGLRHARGAWLGGTMLARMASSDPESLLCSQSAGAALLAGQGLIEAATQRPGTKRTAVVDAVVQRVARGRRVLIFTEFATCATGLIDDLDANGIRVGSVLGGGGKARDRMIAEFQRGDLDVLVCTSSGERGLNLQQADVVVHYDLPWAPKSVIQRTGRAIRIGSVHKSVEVIFPLMMGTIEERVGALVVKRAVEAMRALDSSRGVDASKTEMGLALSGLIDALDDAEDDGSNQSMMMRMTRAAIAA